MEGSRSINGNTEENRALRHRIGKACHRDFNVCGKQPAGTEAHHAATPCDDRLAAGQLLVKEEGCARSGRSDVGAVWRGSGGRKGRHREGYLYLHWFDALFHGPDGPARKADVKLMRYAEDFVALAKRMAADTIEFIESWLEGKFQLEINQEKTRSAVLKCASVEDGRPTRAREAARDDGQSSVL